jgi:protein phosphatase
MQPKGSGHAIGALGAAPAQDAPGPSPGSALPIQQPSFHMTGPVRVEVASLTNVGKVREANEDSYVVCRNGRYLERIDSNVPEPAVPPWFEQEGYIMMVADGMGGMAAGEIASHTAIGSMIRMVIESPRWTFNLDDPSTRETEIQQLWELARTLVGKVHDAVRDRAAADPTLAGMGTTLTSAYSVGNDLFVVHVGDSRAYLWRDGQMERVTRDHTMAQSYADLGIIPQDQVRGHSLHHVLTQAVGGPGEQLHADLHTVKVAPGDRLLLCTDGLTNMVSEEAIAGVLASEATSQEMCRKLVDLALQGGGLDNITAIVARYSAP